MAQRDKSQGFAFVYTDLAQLLKSQAKIEVDSSKPVMPEGEVARFPTPEKAAPKRQPVSADPQVAIKQIRENLDRLQSLHHKLHAMLEELNQVTGKKRR